MKMVISRNIKIKGELNKLALNVSECYSSVALRPTFPNGMLFKKPMHN